MSLSFAALLEMPSQLSSSEIAFFGQGGAQPASSFAWMIGPGVYRGSFVSGAPASGNTVFDRAKLVPYPALQNRGARATGAGDQAQPISVAMTEFHYLLLYKDRIVAVCILNDEVVLDELLPHVRSSFFFVCVCSQQFELFFV